MKVQMYEKAELIVPFSEAPIGTKKIVKEITYTATRMRNEFQYSKYASGTSHKYGRNKIQQRRSPRGSHM